MLLQDCEDQIPQLRTVSVIMNGRSELTFQLKYQPPLTFSELCSKMELNWDCKVKRLRVFNSEGVEFYNEDLKYLRDRERLYVSIKGGDFDVNSSYGEYEVIKPLGEGGFGKVFLARHRQTELPVAIKLMKVNVFSQAGQTSNVFAQAENLKALNHPNIVEILKCFALKDMQVVVVMQYMEGGELLKQLLSQGKFSEQDARVYFKQIVDAVSYCHSKNIIHRDLKLENVLIKSPNSTHIKIADFGISGVVKDFDSNSNAGTLKYMSPQILSGTEKGTTPGVDVWAMGIILYYMVVGKLPFVGTTSSEIIKQITQGQLSFPADDVLSDDLEDLLTRLLTKEPKLRLKLGDIKDHPWFRPFSHNRALSTKVESTNVPKVPMNARQSVDYVSQKKSEKHPSIFQARSSVSIPKRLQKEKGNIVRELLKYGKIMSSTFANEPIIKKQLKRRDEEGKFRKCIIQ